MILLRQIEIYLRQTGLAATTFGRKAVRDPRLVHDLRNGREAGEKLSARVRAWMTEQAA